MLTMNKKNIGNENFVQWMKKLDPITRVETTKAIAKSQSSAGLKGSLIKASLAQLSQRCNVMLVRLSNKEIKHYTRKKSTEQNLDSKPVTKIFKENQDNRYKLIDASTNEINKLQQKIGSKNLSLSSKDKLYKEENGISNSNNPKHQEICNISTCNPKGVLFQSRPSKKLKRKLQELFGEDYDDITVTNNKLSNLNAEDNTSDKNVNNIMSTTVNVNIYNSSSNGHREKSNNLVKKKMRTENTILNVDDSSKNSLRIDVSLSNNKSDIKNTNVETIANHSEKGRKTYEKPHKDGQKKKSHSKKHRSESSKTKHKTAHSKLKKSIPSSLNINTNSPEEDPSIKELWSILGMESPTDRSESIIRSYPYPSSEEKLKSNLQNPSLITSSENPLQGENSHPLETEDPSKTIEPVCKIAETFSLADISSKMPDLFKMDVTITPVSTLVKNEKIPCSTEIGSEPIKVLKILNSNSCNDNGKVIETIAILDDEDNSEENDGVRTENKTQEYQISKGCNKVGSIRVKSLGSLMNPQIISDMSNASDTSILLSNEISVANTKLHDVNTSNSQQTFQPVQNQCSTTKDKLNFEECFFTTYKYYFDEIVESKIPKLGELLHLAVADEIRRCERIKRAEQLSSDDLIKEEKLRAEKDFNDMMRIRGNEFSPLCEIILRKFHQTSKKTLFFTLFCRILKHAVQMDPSNKKYVLEARNVIHTMLSKYQFKDREVMVLLQSGKEEFQKQVDLVNILIEKSTSCNTNVNGNLNKGKLTSTNMVIEPSSSACINKANNTAMSLNTGETNSMQIASKQITPKNNFTSVENQNYLLQQTNTISPQNSTATNNIIKVNDTAISLNTGKTNSMQIASKQMTQKNNFTSVENQNYLLQKTKTMSPQNSAPTNNIIKVNNTAISLNTGKTNSMQIASKQMTKKNNFTSVENQNYLLQQTNTISAQNSASTNNIFKVNNNTKSLNTGKTNNTQIASKQKTPKRNIIAVESQNYLLQQTNAISAQNSASTNNIFKVNNNAMSLNTGKTNSMQIASKQKTPKNIVLSVESLNSLLQQINTISAENSAPTNTVNKNVFEQINRPSTNNTILNNSHSQSVIHPTMNNNNSRYPLTVASAINTVIDTSFAQSSELSKTSSDTNNSFTEPTVVNSISNHLFNQLSRQQIETIPLQVTTVPLTSAFITLPQSTVLTAQLLNVNGPQASIPQTTHHVFPTMPNIKHYISNAPGSFNYSAPRLNGSLQSYVNGQLEMTNNNTPKPKHVVVNRLGAELDGGNVLIKRHCPLIIREKRSSSTVLENVVETPNRNTNQPLNTNISNKSAKPVESSTITTPTVEMPTTSVTNSKSGQTTTETFQSHVPISSHCHPFVRRMPISGKMRMLFGSTNKN